MKITTLSLLTILGLIFYGCNSNKNEEKTTKWQFKEIIPLEGVGGIGIIEHDDQFWISDVDNNRIIKLDAKGELIDEIGGIERPMHLSFDKNQLLIPEYGTDSIRIYENGRFSNLNLSEEVDGLSGVDRKADLLVFTDFYNHRLVMQNKNGTKIIGKEGHNDGELYYPTDIEIFDDLIYVADAYNNRVQVFDFNGNYVQMIGWNEEINVATGLKVTESNVFIADFEGNRMLVYNKDGELIQIFNKHLDKPTDIEILGKNLFVINYKGQSLTVYEKINR